MFAQINLVYNPSFEVLDSCTTAPSQIYYAKGWFQPNAVMGNIKIASSSDLYNSCSPLPNNNVPNNDAGYQYARTGNGYSGIVFLSTSDTSYREYIEGTLLDSMKAGKKYCIEFYVSLAQTWSKYATDAIGLYFTSDSLLDSRPFPLSPRTIMLTPHIKNPSGNIISDTNNWVQVHGVYTATGGEKHFTIGNFSSFSNTNYILATSSTSEYAYYYIDDVSIIDCGQDLSFPNIFTPNNDGINEFFIIENLREQSRLQIFNRWGNEIYKTTNYQNDWDAKNVTDGTYYYLLTTSDNKVYKGFLEVIK